MEQPSESNLPFSTNPPTKRNWRQKSRDFFWQGGKIKPAFWKVSILISLVINGILILVIGFLGQQLFTLKNVVTEDILADLLVNFARLDLAPISTTINVRDIIQVVDTIPVVFDLPLQQDTQVVLTKDTPIKNATIYLNNQPIPLDLVLRSGTPLSINLDLVVPVSQTIPIVVDVPLDLKVPVYIEMSKTDLHGPFIGLQETISPYFWLLMQAPNKWEDVPLCQGSFKFFCEWVLFLE